MPASPHHTLRFGLAVAALVSVRRKQPSAAARLGAVNIISMRPLPVLGLLGRLSALRIHWRIRHLSLGYDARKLGKPGVCRRALAVASVGNASAHAEQCGCGKNHRLHGLSPQIPWALAGLVWDLLHRTICDARKMGFQLGGIIAAWGIGFMRTAKQHLPVRSNARIAGPMCRRCTRQRRKPSTHVGAPRALEDVCEFLGHRSDPELGKLAWPDMRREIRQATFVQRSPSPTPCGWADAPSQGR